MTAQDLNPASKKDRKAVLADLYPLMQQNNLDALIIPHDDEYLSANLNDNCERLAFLTGFTGSAGFAVVIHPKALTGSVPSQNSPVTGTDLEEKEVTITCPNAVLVDGRYTIQAKEQTDPQIFNVYNIKTVNPACFLINLLARGAAAGVDARSISYDEYLKLSKNLDKAGIELKALSCSLIDEIWEDRPQNVTAPVFIYDDSYTGCPAMQKRHDLADRMRKLGIDATLICDPASICWLLNIRGGDRKNLPVVNCRLVAYANEVIEWYVDREHFTEGMESELENHCGHLDIFQEDRFYEVLERLCASSSTVFVDPHNTNALILKILHEGGAKVVEGLGLCELPKAVKNVIEIDNERKAHIKDGIALCRFLAWLDFQTAENLGVDPKDSSKNTSLEGIDEAVLAEKAASYRKVEGEYLEASFDTISALGPNAAMCHYNHQNAKNPRTLGLDALYLIDSGAHYIEGTTDVTRTVMVSPKITDEMRLAYTLVLKSHIALATAVFPKGTSGLQLDAIARRPLWDHGIDYAHGTGHGVGHLLSVHEGPQVISTRQSAVPLEPGMIVSIEPGFYKEGEFGIRLENLVVVEQCIAPGFANMLCFSPLTCVPFDNRLIIKDMLTGRERDWLNTFHDHVREVITENGTTLSEMEINWLNTATAAV